MALITFLSDFGDQDHYTAAVKAAILSENPEARIVDIAHHVKRHDIIHGSHVLKAVYRDFPEGTIHLTAVNIKSKPSEALIALELKGHYFIGSNNGMLGLIEEKEPEKIIMLKEEAESVFPEKTVLAKAAAALAGGKKLEELGEPLADFVRYLPQRMKATKELMQGHVIHVDHYGNLVTNILERDFKILSKNRNYLIKFRNYGIKKVLKHYNETTGGDAFALFNDKGLLEIGIKEGNAAELLGMDYNSMVSITFDDY